MTEPNHYYLHFVSPTGHIIEVYFATEKEAKVVQTEIAERQSQVANRGDDNLFAEPVRFEAINGTFVIQPSAFCCVGLWSCQQALATAVHSDRVRRDREKVVKKDQGSTIGFGDSQ